MTAGTGVGFSDAQDDSALGGEAVARQLPLEEGARDATSEGIGLRGMGVDAQALGPETEDDRGAVGGRRLGLGEGPADLAKGALHDGLACADAHDGAREKVGLSKEGGDPAIGGASIEVHRPASLEHPALPENDELICMGERLRYVVRDEESGGAGVTEKRAKPFPDSGTCGSIKLREGLVEEQEARASEEDAGERDALLHATGEFGAETIGKFLRASDSENLAGAGERGRVGGNAGHGLECVEMREGSGTLGDQRNTALGRRECEEVAAGQQHLAAISGLGASENAQECALARAGGANEAA